MNSRVSGQCLYTLIQYERSVFTDITAVWILMISKVPDIRVFFNDYESNKQ